MEFDKSDTALVVIDPQNDVLSETGVSWGLVGESIRENNTVENLERLFRAAKDGRLSGSSSRPTTSTRPIRAGGSAGRSSG